MAELSLSPKERQALKGRAHSLAPVVLLGSQGMTEAVVREIDRALTAHELIKVRVPCDDRDEREAMFTAVAVRLDAARVQSIGKLLVFYRPRPVEQSGVGRRASDAERESGVGRRESGAKAGPARARSPSRLPRGSR